MTPNPIRTAVVIGTAADGSDIHQITISNGGVTAAILTWGGSLQALRIEGRPQSLVLGCPNVTAYFDKMRYFGAVVGPVANRIAGGRFRLDGTVHQLDRNEAGITTLHGGAEGFGERNWRLETFDAQSCELSLQQSDGHGGFPGNLAVRLRYGLEADGALCVEIEGETDRATYFSPAFHAYWNLDGAPTLANHRLTVYADRYLPVDDRLLPVGEPESVAGTAFDYRRPRVPTPELDHNFCLPEAAAGLRQACLLEAGVLRLSVETTEPGLQVYSGRGIATAPAQGHGGSPYGSMAGIALEPQFWPDTPNHPEYPSSLFRPGEVYRQVSRFAVRGSGD